MPFIVIERFCSLYSKYALTGCLKVIISNFVQGMLIGITFHADLKVDALLAFGSFDI